MGYPLCAHYRECKVKRGTVRAALEVYLTDRTKHDRADAAKDAEWRFKIYVYGEGLSCLWSGPRPV